jgi:MFS family permease
MAQVFISISALLAGVGIMTLGYGLLGTVLAVRMTMEGFATLTSGLVMSGYFLGLLLGSLHVPALMRGVGHIRTFAALASIFSSATLLHVFVIEPVTWGSLRIVEGYCMAGLFLCVESWLNDRATNQTRGAILSFYQITSFGFGAVAQFLLVTAEVDGFFLFALTSVLLSLALVPVAMTRSPAPPIPERSVFGVRRLMEISPLGVVGCTIAGLTSGAFYALLPRFGAVAGFDPFGIAVLMGGSIFGGMILQWPLGRLSDRMDRRKMIAWVGLALTVAAGLIAWATLEGAVSAPEQAAEAISASVPMTGWLVVLILAFGGTMFAIYPLALSHANDFIDRGDFVAASGGLIMFFSIGATLGPTMAGALMETAGTYSLFGYMAVCGLALALVAAWRLRAPAVAPEQKTPFQVTPRTALALHALDPRAEDDQYSFDFTFGEPAPEDSLDGRQAA